VTKSRQPPPRQRLPWGRHRAPPGPDDSHDEVKSWAGELSCPCRERALNRSNSGSSRGSSVKIEIGRSGMQRMVCTAERHASAVCRPPVTTQMTPRGLDGVCRFELDSPRWKDTPRGPILLDFEGVACLERKCQSVQAALAGVCCIRWPRRRARGLAGRPHGVSTAL
jgi:hypothetical protein